MLGFVIGTRPELIKMAPIMRLLDADVSPYYLVFTNQHSRKDMAQDFFTELEIRNPDLTIDGVLNQQALDYLGDTLQKQGVETVLVEGDTDSVLFGATAAMQAGLNVCHVESGLRCGDITMTEEKNRIAVDHLSEFLCAPTRRAADNLEREHVKGQIYQTGNTIVDALRLYATQFVTDQPMNSGKPYVLATLHRRENVDDPKRLNVFMNALESVGEVLELPVILPLHPRTAVRLGEEWVWRKVRACPPMGYFRFVDGLRRAALVLTDSGGVQEEAAILGVPCVTMRSSTERQETVEAGVNVLADTVEDIVLAAQQMLSIRRCVLDLYGDGHAADKILNVVLR